MLISPVITACARRSVGLADLMLKDMSADRFARLPIGANGPVQTNHPAFIYGHLALYPPRALAMMGLNDHAAFTTPEDQQALFKAGAECVDDPDGTIYPSMHALVARFRAGYAAFLDAVEHADDEALGRATPDEKFRERFPTVGVVANFLLNDHLMLHLGQASAWRRVEGLGPVM